MRAMRAMMVVMVMMWRRCGWGCVGMEGDVGGFGCVGVGAGGDAAQRMR